MNDIRNDASEFKFLAGGGEMGKRIRDFDWGGSPLGPIQGWPQSLKTSVSLMLNSQHPMWIGWGEEATFLYNDAYIQVLSLAKHPWALGTPAAKVWAEIWDICGPLAEKVFRKGEASFLNDVRLFMSRGDFLEETFYSFSYSPIRDESGNVGGLFCPSADVTAKALNTRRLRCLSELAAESLVEKTTEGACASAAAILARNRDDIPFALLYLLDATGQAACLEQAVSIPKGQDPVSPQAVELAGKDVARQLWPLSQVVASAQLKIVSILGSDGFPTGAADQPVTQAVLLPVVSRGQARPLGVLVAGVNPTRKLDVEYRTFYELVASHIATAIQNARAAEEEKRRADALAELDRAKTTFFSNVSHEFRTPMTLMLGPLEDLLARRHALAAEDRSDLEVVHRNCLRLLKLVNTLLDFSRIEAGRIEASFEPTDLAAYTSELAGVFRSGMERAGLRLLVDCPALSEIVYVDRDMWEKIVFNLLSNAFKFTAKGEIEVRLRETGNGGDGASFSTGAVSFSVRDTGIGIPAEEVPRVFERFHRVRNSWARSHEGTGIGLALVRELARLHGGNVSVESIEGRGTTFTVSIPMGRAHLPKERIGAVRTLASTNAGARPFVEEASRWLPESPGSSLPQDGDGNHPTLPFQGLEVVPAPGRKSKGRILLADDNSDMRDYVRRLLVGSGYEVISAENGQVALEMVHQLAPALVLSDVMMPHLDGFGLLRELRKDPVTRAIPIILLSARAGEEARIEGVESGADDYVTKPFSSRELLARIETHLKLARLRREAGEAIRQREERLQATMDSITDGLHVIDSSGRLSYFNAAARRVLAEHGQNADELIGCDFFEVFPATFGVEVGAALKRTLGERVPTEAESFSEPWRRWFSVRHYPSADGGVSSFFQDITERKRAAERERKLAAEALAATAKFRAVFEQSSIFAGIMTLEGKVIEANRLCLEACGYRADEVLGKPFWECGWWRGLPAVLEKIRAGTARAARGEIYAEVLPYHWADGTERMVEFALYPIRDDKRRVIFLHPTGMDITERHRAQARADFLGQLTQKLSTVSDAEEINQIATSEVGRFLGAHRCFFFEAFVGLSQIRVLPGWCRGNAPALEGVYNLADLASPDCWQGVQGGALGVHDVRAHPWTRNFAANYHAADIAAYTLASFVHEGRWVACAGVSADQPRRWTREEMALLENVVARVWPLIERARADKALRENRARFDIVKDAAQVGFWFCDLPFDKLIWDPRVKEHFWLAPEAAVTIDTFYDRLHPDDRERTRQAIADSIANHIRYEIDYRTVAPNGAEKWIRAMGGAFYDGEGQPTRFDGVTLDTTERKRAEEALREANALLADKAAHLESLVQQRTAKLRETIGELEAFSYSIAHDMRAPLRSLQGFSDILLTDFSSKLDPECQRYLRRISLSADRMDKLIRDVLDYSRVVRAELPLETIDVDALLHGILDSYPMLASEKADTILEGPFPPVLGNEAMLTQVFSNLMGNAVKFVAPGVRPRVKIWAEPQAETVRFLVQDNGIGIAADQHEKIFAIFQRVNKDFEGTGIGLAIVRKAVERMGGKTGLHSELGAGSTFWIEMRRPQEQQGNP